MNHRNVTLPSETIQADRLAWLTQVQRGELGDPAKLLTGVSASDLHRWEIGVADAWQHPRDPTKIVLKLPKPTGHPEGEAPSTEYWFDQEAVWLLQAHILYGGRLGVYKSKVGKPGKPSGYYYPYIRIDGFARTVNVDRYIGGSALTKTPGWRTRTTTTTTRGPTLGPPQSARSSPSWVVRMNDPQGRQHGRKLWMHPSGYGVRACYSPRPTNTAWPFCESTRRWTSGTLSPLHERRAPAARLGPII